MAWAIGKSTDARAVLKATPRPARSGLNQPSLAARSVLKSGVAAIFISYRNADAADQAALLYHMLARRWSPETVFFDQRDLEVGATFPPLLDRAVTGCRLLLLLIGPKWLEELNRRAADPAVDYVRAEVLLALARRREQACEIVPVLVKGGRMPDASNLALVLRPQLEELCTINAWTWGDTEAVRELLVSRIADRLPALDAMRPAAGPLAQLNPDFQNAMRQRSLHFRDPSDVLRTLATTLMDATQQNQPARAVLVGPAGIGKTQLALQYAQQSQRRYAAICWLSALDGETLQSALHRCCAHFSLTAQSANDSALALRVGVEEQPRPWLLVFDGANEDTAATVIEACPANAIHHIIVTSTHPRWKARVVPVLPWSPEQGAAYLRRRIESATPEEAAELSEELSGLPLALDQAACYIENQKCAVEEYRLLLIDPKSAPELLSERLETSADTPYDKSIRDTVLIACTALSPAARQCLRLCAEFAPNWLPESTLRGSDASIELLPELMRPAAADELAWIKLRGELHRAGLISAVRESLLDFEDESPAAEPEPMIRMSPLTQRVVRLFITGSVNDHSVAVFLLSHAIEREAGRAPHWPRLRALSWHARHVGLEGDDADSALLAKRAGDVLMTLGEPMAALDCRRRWRQHCERHALDAGNPVLVQAQLDFAWVALGLRDFDAAEAWARHVMQAGAPAVDNPADPNDHARALARSVLVKALLQQRRWVEAHDAARAYLQDREAVARDVDLAQDLLNDFGQALRGAGELAKARAVQVQVVAKLAALNAGTPTEATTWEQLAVTQAALGEFDAALTLQTRVLAAREAERPLDPLRLGVAHAGLAATLESMGRAEAAAEHWALACRQLSRCLPARDPLRQHAETRFKQARDGQEVPR